MPAKGSIQRQVVVTCEECGEPFQTFMSRVKRGRSRFCSQDCYFRWRRRPVKNLSTRHANGTVSINLTRGQIAVIDAVDFDRVSPYSWSAKRGRSGWYAQANIPDGTGAYRMVTLHRFILGVADDVLVDHEDGNGLNNRRSNMRPCTNAENSRNQGIRSNNTSGFKGVYFDKRYKKWTAQIQPGGQTIFLGYHRTREAAARAYDVKARELFGEFARLNFPDA